MDNRLQLRDSTESNRLHGNGSGRLPSVILKIVARCIDLTYTVQFDYPLAGKECEYVLQQFLPSAVYVSTDQLGDLKRLNKLNVDYPEFVDVEVITEKSSEFTVLLRGMPKITDKIKLPIHFRYHAPRDKKSHITVTINTPRMYMNCPDADKELVSISDTLYCIKDNSNIVDKFNQLQSNDTDNEECNWRQIEVDFQLKLPLNANIPIGNTKSYSPVIYGTIILSWITSLASIYVTRDVPRRINSRLNEQRILQEKFK